LRHFAGGNNDGSSPNGLIEGTNGVLYGTCQGGGTNNVGLVFKLNKDGTDYMVLKQFRQTGGGGANPIGALVEGNDGLLYGVTGGGGSSNAGQVFKLNKDGSGFTVLRDFAGGND